MKPRSARGFVLLLIVLVLIAIGGVAILSGIAQNKIGGTAQRTLATQIANGPVLDAARLALIGFATTVGTTSGQRPGQLPLPDTLANTNYDGTPDSTSCLNANATNGLPALSSAAAMVTNLRCLGRLPWKTLGLAIDGVSEQDSTGVVPWYAASPNLADPNTTSPCMSVLNPTTAASTPTTFNCTATTTPAWPWLKVCDGTTGRLLSDRVAFVLIMPGRPLETYGRSQTRSNAASGSNPSGYGNPADFLDAITTPAGWSSLAAAARCSTYDNAGLTDEFVKMDSTSSFNDQLVYVTIDELMVEIEKRVALEVREDLVAFRTQNGSYPWLAPVGNPAVPLTAHVASVNTLSGLMPFNYETTPTLQTFMTELAWNIISPVASDTRSPAGNLTTAQTEFACGSCLCRPRTLGITAIARSITDAQFTAIKNGTTTSVTTPALTCQRDNSSTAAARNLKLTCASYTYTLTSAVSYAIQRRSGNCTTGGYTAGSSIGTYAGTQTRTITLDFTSLQGTGSPTYTPGSSTTHARRAFTTGAMVTGTLPSSFMISVTDRWVPSTLGTTPFATFATTFPSGMLTGSAQTTAMATSVTVSNIRLAPDMPSWYASQNWYEHIYVSLSPSVSPTTNSASCSGNCLTVGSRSNIDFAVISTGAALAGQTRYSGTPTAASFLESANATGSSTRSFNSSTDARSTTYQDSVVTLPR